MQARDSDIETCFASLVEVQDLGMFRVLVVAALQSNLVWAIESCIVEGSFAAKVGL